jgi:hypothetical protein
MSHGGYLSHSPPTFSQKKRPNCAICAERGEKVTLFGCEAMLKFIGASRAVLNEAQ